MYGKQTFASHTSDNTVHLYNSRLRITFKKLLEIAIVSTNTTSSVYLELRLFVTMTIFHLTRQVDVPYIKKLGINIIIQCFFAAFLTSGLMIPFILAISSSLDKMPVLDSEID